ncbi:MAG: hypothetical protein MJZ25_13330 [Fibrobacter sp.]|nr:hypothetical protein [Fibrobacter sp.]
MQFRELISPDKLVSVVQAKAEELLAAITTIDKRLRKSIEGRLRMARRKNSVHYFHVKSPADIVGDYIPQSDVATIKALAQKDYDKSALKELQRELFIVDKFLKEYQPECLNAVYCNLAPERQRFLQPVRLPDEEYAVQWLAVKYSGKGMAVDAPLLETSRGERVRSKSEVIIADTLDRLKIPYRYEFPHQLKVRRNSRGRDSSRRTVTFHPDFTCLNIRTRREFIWEHFGRMDDPEYIAETLGKFETYTANGIFPGESLIFTMETQECPLNPATVEALASKFLL